MLKTTATGMAMTSGGDYSLSTRGAKDVIDRAVPRFYRALDEVITALDPQPLVIADFGCADGGTSVDAVRALSRRAQESRTNRPILIVYEDQPANDFNALTKTTHTASASDGAALHDAAANIHVVASGPSFYQRALPAGMLHLGISATAMHWLSKKPCDIDDHVHAVGAKGPQLAAFATQAAEDWLTILSHRASELAVGGRLVLCNFCRDENGFYLGHTGGVSMFETFRRLWSDFRDQGRITAAEFKAITLPQYYRDMAEFVAPFEDHESPVYLAGLRLESIETGITPCSYAEHFADTSGDPRAFAEAYIPTLRSWSQSAFFNGLDSRRDRAHRQELINDFYQAYIDLVADDPTGHAMDYVHAYLTIYKAG